MFWIDDGELLFLSLEFVWKGEVFYNEVVGVWIKSYVKRKVSVG